MMVREPSLLDIVRAEETAGSMVTLSLRLNEYLQKHKSLAAIRPPRDAIGAVLRETSPMNDWVWENDEWGTRFRVEIESDDSFRIVSAGADRAFQPDAWSRPMEPDPKEDQVFLSGKGFSRVMDRAAYGQRLLNEAMANPGKPSRPEVQSGPVIHRVGGDVKAPVLVKRIDVPYPPALKKEKKVGLVIVEVIIDASGKLQDLKILYAPDPAFGEVVRETVAQWEFLPGTLDGKPVAVYYNLTVQFALE